LKAWLKMHGWAVLRQTFHEWVEDDGFTLAAAMAYYAAFSFFPLLLVLLAVMGFVLRFSPAAQNEQQILIEWIGQSSSDALAGQIDAILSLVKNRATVSGPLGLVTLLIGAIALFTQMDAAFDRIWKVASPHPTSYLWFARRVLVDRFKAFVMLLCLGLLVLVSFVVGMFLSALSSYAQRFPGSEVSSHFLHGLGILVFNTFLFTLVYKVLPKTKVCWREAFAGGVLVAAIWELGRQVLALLVIGTHYSAYGVIGTFVAMMVWVYYASSILFLGAEMVKVVGRRRRPDGIGCAAAARNAASS
jgi:membrane protein